MQDIKNLPTSQIVAGNNDRTNFDKNALHELASSIAEHGLAQPITVRPQDDVFQIVAGERRFRAITSILGWTTIPAIIRDLTDEQASAIMLAENVARADLDPIDEAIAYHHRMDAYGWTVQDCADKAGVSTIRIQFRLKLLRLRPELQNLVRSDQLPLGYAQILSDANLDPNRQMLALRHLRDNPSPTPSWFRKVVNRLLEEQAQGIMFDLPLMTGNIATSMMPETAPEPPHPATSTPPKSGKTASEILNNQVSFWTKAADAWDNLGKPFKRQECQAAAQALQLALNTI